MKTKILSDENKSAAADLCRLSMHLDTITNQLFEEKTFGDADFDPEITRVAYNDNSEKVIGFIMGVIRQRDEGKIGYIKLICVHPEHRREGIASGLLNLVEEKFKKEKVTRIRVFESYPNYYMPGLDPFYTEAVCFFERNGYKKFSDTSNLEAVLVNQNFDTAEEEEKLKIDKIDILRAEKHDFEEALKWTEVNFKAWISEVKNSFENNPISLYIAKKENEIIAFSAYETNNFGTGWFGPMGTSEKARGKGLGGILFKRCLGDMKKLGFQKAIIPWVGPIPFYMHYANSKVKRVFWRYEKLME